MISKTTIDQLRAVWSQGVQDILDHEIQMTQTALVDATAIETIYALQGKARAFRTLRSLPNYLANFVDEGDSDK